MRHRAEPADLTPLSPFEKAALGLTVLFAVAAAVAVIGSLCGCVYRGAKVIEGTDVAVGLNVPSTDGSLQLQLLNYLSGFRLGVAENSSLTLEYSSSSTNSFLGVVETRSEKRIKAKVEPCEAAAD